MFNPQYLRRKKEEEEQEENEEEEEEEEQKEKEEEEEGRRRRTKRRRRRQGEGVKGQKSKMKGSKNLKKVLFVERWCEFKAHKYDFLHLPAYIISTSCNDKLCEVIRPS